MIVYLLFCTPWVWINLLIVQANLGKKETEVDLLGSAAASVLCLLYSWHSLCYVMVWSSFRG